MTATLLRIALLACMAVPAEALAARSDWAAAEQSQLRLLLAGPQDGHIVGGIEILLEPGWYTYWRNPGDAGVPPLFDFAGSENVASVEVLYPAPERQDDGTSVSLVYRDEIVLPLFVTPAIPGQAVTLRVEARFGVCRDICIPTGTSSAVTLPASAQPDPLAEARLERYRMRLPKAAEPGRFDVETVTLEGETLLIDVRAPDSSYLDLFAEPPANWYVGQPSLVSRAAGMSHYRLELGGRPDGAQIEGQRFRFVAVAGGEAIEKAVEIR